MYRKNNFSSNIREDTDSAIETENDRLTDELKDKIKSLKSVRQF